MSKIRVLDKHVAELIAAGEVVERPSSVVKEMVENALDAGATAVTVEIKNGGVSYIRITDNGSGIERDDVVNAFKRHATSKIKSSADLDAIATLGFRGEALASIAAVSRLELLTKTKAENYGTRYVIEGGEEVLLDDAGCPDGSTFVIRDLFFNTPARMKFLKKDVSEGNAVADVLDRLALSHPGVSFQLIRDGKKALQTPGDGKLISAIHAVFGNEFASSLIPVDYTKDGISVTGYTCKPVFARKNRSMQIFFVNGRFVKTGTGSAALQEAYKNAIMAGKFPAGVYHLQFPYQQIDVNVHPAKIEIRFSNERAIFDVLYYGIKSALNRGDSRPAMQLEHHAAPVLSSEYNGVLKKASSAFNQPAPAESKSPPKQGVQTKFNMIPPTQKVLPVSTFALRDSGVPHNNNTRTQSGNKPFVSAVSGSSLDVFVDDGVPENVPNIPVVAKEKISVTEQVMTEEPQPTLKIIGEAFKTYLLVEVDDRILVIDKHAAHERILFDRLKDSVVAGQAQMLLTPLTLTMRKEEYSLLIENADLLEQAGILLDSFGQDVVRVLAVPMNLEDEDIRLLMDEIVYKLSHNAASVTADKLDWLYHSIACRSAVKGGNTTSLPELEVLAKQIVTDDSIRYCPHGRPVAMWLTKSQLEKQFGRSGG